jgi:hypothetical protein
MELKTRGWFEDGPKKDLVPSRSLEPPGFGMNELSIFNGNRQGVRRPAPARFDNDE